MYVMKGGNLYGFCPAKARWDSDLVEYFKVLLICAEMRILPQPGSIYEQNYTLIDDLFWFLPMYDLMKFSQKADMILGDDKKSSASNAKAIRSRLQGS